MWPPPLQAPGDEAHLWGVDKPRDWPWEEAVPALLRPPDPGHPLPAACVLQQINFSWERSSAITVNTTPPGVTGSSLFIIPN